MPELNYLEFENAGYKYQIYQKFTLKNHEKKVGIKIKNKATNKETDIKGETSSIEGSLRNLDMYKEIRCKIF